MTSAITNYMQILTSMMLKKKKESNLLQHRSYLVLATIPISSNNTVFTKLIAEVWEHTTSKKSNRAKNRMSQTVPTRTTL